MNKRWEIRKVSTPEHIFDKIKEEVARPVGIIVFGVDCDFKNEVVDAMVEELRGFAHYHSKYPGIDTLIWEFNDRAAVVVVLNSESSMTHRLRHELVQTMRNAGAKTIIGIYAKATAPQPLPSRGYLKSQLARRKNTAEVLAKDPPTADGLDYFIVVEEEKEG